MNVLFISLIKINSIQDHGIYPDLLRKAESSQGYSEAPNVKIVPACVGKIQKTNVITKGINTVLIGGRIKKIIKKQLANTRIDLVLYATPPMTIDNVISYIKKRDGAKSYLMLKDIVPQGMIDFGMLKKNGPSSLIYNYFRYKEKKLYAVSDHIGCMSPAGVQYLLKHDSEIPSQKIGLCPNSIEARDLSLGAEEKTSMRQKYGLPTDKTIFVYGGNLGKPQGIPFIIECMKSQMSNSDVFFLIVGSGTEYRKLEDFFRQSRPTNMKLMKSLSKDEYDRMVAACDVGLIFLDHRISCPNVPSRLLSYMQANLPVLACTDPCTDVGKIIVGGGFGWWCESDDVSQFAELINKCLCSDITGIGEKGYKYLLEYYTVEKSYEMIISSLYKKE